MVIRLLIRVGALYLVNELYDKAEIFIKYALDDIDVGLLADRDAQVKELQKLAAVFRSTHRPKEAESVLIRALDILGRENREDNLNTVILFNSISIDIALVYAETERKKQAEALLLSTIRSYNTTFGPDSTQSVQAMISLASIYAVEKTYKEAERYLNCAIRTLETQNLAEELIYSDALAELAYVYFETNLLTNCESLLRRAVLICETKCGEDHPLLARRMCFLAEVLNAQGKLDEGTEVAMQACKIFDEYQMHNHSPHPDAQIALGVLNKMRTMRSCQDLK